jgi:hypothetical protein
VQVVALAVGFGGFAVSSVGSSVENSVETSVKGAAESSIDTSVDGSVDRSVDRFVGRFGGGGRSVEWFHDSIIVFICPILDSFGETLLGLIEKSFLGLEYFRRVSDSRAGGKELFVELNSLLGVVTV